MKDNLNFNELLMPVPARAKFTDEGWWVWCGSMVRDDNGKCHLFYSRWPRETGFQSWVTHSQIAHAVADDPLGPYKFSDVTLPVRGKDYWDGHCTHNPTIQRFGEKYYLYYMGNYGDLKIQTDPIDLNWTHRNNQRVGVAVADSPYGPWQRFDKPLLDVSEDKNASDALCVNNPSVTQMPDGRYLMVNKAVARRNPMPFGGPVSHRVAIADTPLGTFIKVAGEVFTAKGCDFPAEDPYIWYSKEHRLYYALVKDMKGNFTNKGTSVALFRSIDGIKWEPANNPLACELKINWESGEQKVFRLERPQVWFNNGKPAVFFAAVMDLDGNTFNVHIPLCEN